jgi:hypothetical protein
MTQFSPSELFYEYKEPYTPKPESPYYAEIKIPIPLNKISEETLEQAVSPNLNSPWDKTPPNVIVYKNERRDTTLPESTGTNFNDQKPQTNNQTSNSTSPSNPPLINSETPEQTVVNTDPSSPDCTTDQLVDSQKFQVVILNTQVTKNPTQITNNNLTQQTQVTTGLNSKSYRSRVLPNQPFSPTSNRSKLKL